MSKEVPKKEKNKIFEDDEREKHLTCDMPIRYRGHPSEMIPRHGELQTTMKGKDIHYKGLGEENVDQQNKK